MLRTRSKGIALVSAIAAAVLLVSGCSSSSSSSSASGKTTLKVRLFGTFGYKEAGLFDEYQKLHPNIKIDYTTRRAGSDLLDRAADRPVLRCRSRRRAGHRGRPHRRRRPSQLSDKFVDLNTLGAASLKDNFYPWKWQESMAGSKQLGPRHRHRPAGHLLPHRPVQGGRPADRPDRGQRAVGQRLGRLRRGRTAVQGARAAGQRLDRHRRRHVQRDHRPVAEPVLRRVRQADRRTATRP